MEEVHRDTIQRNIRQLMSQVNLESLYPLLIAEGIIDLDDVKRIQNQFPDSVSSQALEFFLWYRTRGPMAFSTLKQSLIDSGHESVAELLQSPSNTPVISNLELPLAGISNGCSGNGDAGSDEEFCDLRRTPSPLVNDPIDKELQASALVEEQGHLDIVVRDATLYNNGNTEVYSEEKTAYEMMLKPRGFALLINNIHFEHPGIDYREGAKFDSIHLKKLLEAFHFEVTDLRDLRKEDLDSALQTFIKKFTTKKVNACFVAVMSHGVEDYILMKDGGHAPIWTEIICRFNNRNCPDLIGIPKIFLINACRGDRHDMGVPKRLTDAGGLPTVASDNEEILPAPDYKEHPEVKDIIVCHSTIPEYVANRDPERGTYYVSHFCEVFMNHAHNTELKKMLDIVGRKMEGLCKIIKTHQVPSYTSYGFNYDLFFNPGLPRGGD